MSQSISFILPVHNMQYRVRDRVTVVTELLAELTDRFDVLIVDYGSEDDTREVAMDLIREFPQVDYIEQPVGGELYDAIELGILRTTGQIIFVHDPALPLGVSAIQNLWNMRDDEDLVMAQSRSNDVKPTSVSTFSSGNSSATAASSIQMIRRCAMPPLPAPSAKSTAAVERVTRTDLMEDQTDVKRLPKLLTRLRRLANSSDR